MGAGRQVGSHGQTMAQDLTSERDQLDEGKQPRLVDSTVAHSSNVWGGGVVSQGVLDALVGLYAVRFGQTR